MTRITNFGRNLKRTYVEAGFANETAKVVDQSLMNHVAIDTKSATESGHTKKRRKRTKLSQRTRGIYAKSAEPGADFNGSDTSKLDVSVQTSLAPPNKHGKKSKTKNPRAKSKVSQAYGPEQRRLKRIEEREAETTCFACREKGHAAKNCPKTVGEDSLGNLKDLSVGKFVVGICYRCGSTKHTLARCKKQVDAQNPLPFASCFVCSRKGHLASSCSQNRLKGIYPNGGCCKLCGDTTHLARNCGVRTQASIADADTLGTGKEAGADEDDFHLLKRKKAPVDREVKQEDKLRDVAGLKVESHFGVVKAFGTLGSQPKKVVYF